VWNSFLNIFTTANHCCSLTTDETYGLSIQIFHIVFTCSTQSSFSIKRTFSASIQFQSSIPGKARRNTLQLNSKGFFLCVVDKKFFSGQPGEDSRRPTWCELQEWRHIEKFALYWHFVIEICWYLLPTSRLRFTVISNRILLV